MDGTVFSIEEFSIYDGPGIRTAVFLKGCPLSCSWCHNPEGQDPEIQVIKSPNGCIRCGSCAEFAEKKNGGLVFSDKSIKNCPMKLLRSCGERFSPEKLCQVLLKNASFLKNGGVTFSGGEPLMQSDFLLDCLTILNGKLHTAVQTCGFCSKENFLKVLSAADYFLFDIKLADNELHKKYTGVSNIQILSNFKALAESGKAFVCRIPLIPTVTDTEENITGIADILSENGVNYVQLMPYNKMAGGKYAMVGREYTPDFDEKKEPVIREKIFNDYKITFDVL